MAPPLLPPCALAALLLAVPLAGCVGSAPRSMVLATTTSTKDTGLLDQLVVPRFDSAYHVDVKVVAVGTGRALELGRTGDADVVLVHAPATERAYLANGSYVARYEVMWNQFLLVGPPGDPARLAEAPNITTAFAAMAASKVPFVSRGDQSGTHIKEQQLWALAGYNYSRDIAIPNNTWYHAVGQGMGATLRVAAEMPAYCLSDDGTFYTTQPAGLVAIRNNEPLLRNQYSVMLINATRHPNVQAGLAQDFADWMVSNATQQAIAGYAMNGHHPFTPDAGVVERS